MKSFAKYAVLGISGVVMFKLFATLVLPLIGLVFGLIGLTIKLALVAAVALFIYAVFFKKDEDDEVSPEGEIVVEMEVEEDDEDDDD